MRGLRLWIALIVAITLAGAWAALSLLGEEPAPRLGRLQAGAYDPAPPMRQLYPGTWFFGELPHQPHWSDVQFEGVELVCGAC